MHIVRVGGWGVTFSKAVFIVAFYSEETVVKRLCKKKNMPNRCKMCNHFHASVYFFFISAPYFSSSNNITKMLP